MPDTASIGPATVTGLGFRLLVCGGREWNDQIRMDIALDAVHDKRSIAMLIHGGAKGADTQAGEWAEAHGVPVMVFHADWHRHGRKAGPMRNKEMLFNGRPDGVVAMPGGRGTDDMVRRALIAGVKVWRPYGVG